MSASIVCPRCSQRWAPASRQAAASPVCLQCRKTPVLAPAVTTRPAPDSLNVPTPDGTARPARRHTLNAARILGPLAVVAAVLAVGALVGLGRLALRAEHVAPDGVPVVQADPSNLPTALALPDALQLKKTVAAEPELMPYPKLAASAEVKPVVPPTPAVVAKPEPAPFKRRKPAPRPDELIRQLMAVKEIELESTAGGPVSKSLIAHAQTHKAELIHPMPTVLTRRADLAGLPLRMGVDCHLGKESAETLHVLSGKLRTHLSEACRAGLQRVGASATLTQRPDVATLKQKLTGDGDHVWDVPEAVPTLVQMLQVEDKALRQLLVEMLARIKGSAASRALAQRAVFDVSDEVREQAARALRERPTVEYQEVLLDGMRYPWAPPAEFAAEALIHLKLTAVVPTLIGMLGEPNPAQPFSAQVGNADVKLVREIVRVNHLRNCMLCHAPSLEQTDLVRGTVPDPRRPLSPSYGNNGSLSQFVRADVTYLMQDFSLPQEVANHGPWPTYQRFDYLVRTHPVTERVSAGPNASDAYPQRDSVLFALRELTGEDHGSNGDAWFAALQKAVNDASKRKVDR